MFLKPKKLFNVYCIRELVNLFAESKFFIEQLESFLGKNERTGGVKISKHKDKFDWINKKYDVQNKPKFNLT